MIAVLSIHITMHKSFAENIWKILKPLDRTLMNPYMVEVILTTAMISYRDFLEEEEEDDLYERRRFIRSIVLSDLTAYWPLLKLLELETYTWLLLNEDSNGLVMEDGTNIFFMTELYNLQSKWNIRDIDVCPHDMEPQRLLFGQVLSLEIDSYFHYVWKHFDQQFLAWVLQ